MALAIYPIPQWQSFITEAEADSFMLTQLNNEAWNALDPIHKDSLLIQTATQMRLCKSIVLPETNEDDLKLGQSYLLLHASNVDMLAYDPNGKAISSESVDVISVSYFEGLKNGTETFPPMVTSLLNQYGCRSTTGGFQQVPLGRG